LAVGTKMAIAGLRGIGVRDPKGKDHLKIMVFVEIDRCVSDAITAVTGCRPGRRTMRIVDYGKIAATFLNLETGKALRLSLRDCFQDEAPAGWAESRIEPFMGLSDRDIFHIEEVAVMVPPEDTPGRLVWAAMCEKCGEIVMDMRGVRRDGSVLCKPCALGMSYYTKRQGHSVPVRSGHGRV
jgi:formylmethanofuran dehydrogenase subunit E